MSTQTSSKPATKPTVTDNGKIKIGGAALSLIKAARK
jgi:hypothetical protein